MQRLIVAVWLLWVTAASSAASLPDVIDRIRPSVVGIGTAYPPRQPNLTGEPVRYRGTGFVVGNGLQVVTSLHVIPGNIDSEHKEMLVVFSGHGSKAQAHPARVSVKDEEHDLVLLEMDGPPLPPMEIGNSDSVREGQEIAFTGYPLGIVLGLYPVTHRGIVASITPIVRPAQNAETLTPARLQRLRNNIFDTFQLDAIAYPGNSGSPVYELATGQLIGVMNSVFVKGSKESAIESPSGISYAIPGRYVKRLLLQMAALQQ